MTPTITLHRARKGNQRSAMDRICAAAKEAVEIKIIEEGFEFVSFAESPIETLFGAAICAHFRYVHFQSDAFQVWPQEQFDAKCLELERSALEKWAEYPVLACNQYQIGGIRVDFCFAHRNWRNGKVFRLIVECDGHDFHDRTKEQASNDRARDRALQAMGHNVFRFTGSDIWRDPMKCAEQVADWIDHKACEKP